MNKIHLDSGNLICHKSYTQKTILLASFQVSLGQPNKETINTLTDFSGSILVFRALMVLAIQPLNSMYNSKQPDPELNLSRYCLELHTSTYFRGSTPHCNNGGTPCICEVQNIIKYQIPNCYEPEVFLTAKCTKTRFL